MKRKDKGKGESRLSLLIDNLPATQKYRDSTEAERFSTQRSRTRYKQHGAPNSKNSHKAQKTRDETIHWGETNRFNGVAMVN